MTRAFAAGLTVFAALGAGPKVAVVVPGPTPTFAWPAAGQGAVAVAGVGLVGRSPGETRVPIASLTKMMTTLVVLHDHPLAPGQAGPAISIGSDDVVDWQQETKAGDSVVEVRAGETMTEYQALEALLVPSADNIADRLAAWDAGSIPAFVAKMNATAKALGLASTRYVDPSGVDPGSSSTAADQAFVASRLMENPVPRSIVRRARINLPVVGIIPNHNPALRVDGILGVKGGYSSHAHNCLVTAAYRLHGAALVVSVALGQRDGLTAAHVDEALLQSATRVLYGHRLFEVSSGSVPPFGFWLEHVRNGRFLTAVVWPGLVLHETSVAGETTVSTPWGSVGPFAQAGKR